jgi:tight adherence protein B
MDYLYYIFGILIFVAVVLALEGAYLAWNGTRGPEAARIARRLRQMTARGEVRQASMIKERVLSHSPGVQQLLARAPLLVDPLDNLLQQSGLGWTVGRLLGSMLAGFFGGLLLAVLLGAGSGTALVVATVSALLPLWHVRRSRSARLRKIEQQLPDAMDMMGRALRAGHAFPTALKMVGDESAAPLADEFKAVFDEVNFGLAMQDSLIGLAARVPVTDLRFFVIAVVIQRETGGNLAELLANISSIMRDRMKLMGQVRVLSAEGKMSAWILSMLPFGSALLIHLTNPSFLAVLYTDPGGQKMIAFALTMMALGVLAMRYIINIRV